MYLRFGDQSLLELSIRGDQQVGKIYDEFVEIQEGSNCYLGLSHKINKNFDHNLL